MILMIGSSPVAGVVERLARWAGPITGVDGYSVVRRNYPNNVFRLPNGAIDALPNWRVYVASILKQASLCVIHNVYDRNFLDFIFEEKPNGVPIVFQIHSPPLEPPAFTYFPVIEYNFDRVLAVAQGYQRFVPGSIGVPNVVPDTTYPVPIRRSRTIFIPHLRSTEYRWSRKFTEYDHKTLQHFVGSLSDLRVRTVQDVFGRSSATHEEILFFLRSVAILVDDINTGLFHQTTIEGLKAQALIFSGADYVSQEEHCIAADADPLPVIPVSGISDVIAHLSDFRFETLVEERRKNITEYAQRFLGEERLASQYFGKIIDLLK